LPVSFELAHPDRRAAVNPFLYFQGYDTPGYKNGVIAMYDAISGIFYAASADEIWSGAEVKVLSTWKDGEPAYIPIDVPL